MKIVLIANHTRPGGITTYVTVLARELTRRGHRVLVVSGGGEAADAITASGAEHRNLFLNTSSELNPRLWRAAAILRSWVEREGWQLVHAQTRVGQAVSALALRGLRVPRVTTCHGYFKTRIFRRLVPLWGDRVIAISRAVERHLLDDWEVPRGRVRYVPHGVEKLYGDDELQRLRQQARAVLKAPPGTVQIAAFGRLSPVKGYHVLLEAMKRVADLPVRLTLIGDGPEAARLDRMIAGLGLQERVRRVPSITNHHDILHAFDAFCAPSLQEGLGLSALDAMARGTAVIASAVGGLRDLIRDGETGYAAAPGDPESLSRAIRSMAADPDARQRIGAAGRRFVEREFTLAGMIGATEQVYEELVIPKTIDRSHP